MYLCTGFVQLNAVRDEDDPDEEWEEDGWDEDEEWEDVEWNDENLDEEWARDWSRKDD